MRQIFLDTETTGLSADNGDRVIEIGCVELVNRKLTGNNRHFYLNPGRDSHEEALKVHGITNEFLKDKPKFEAVAADLLDYLKDAELVIHNAPFDLGFLDMEFGKLGHHKVREIVASVTDTLVMAKELYPGKRNSLDALCDRLEVDNSGRTLHGALLDAEILAEVYLAMTRGQETLSMDIHAPAQAGSEHSIDVGGLRLASIALDDDDVMAHTAYLEQMAKKCKDGVVWMAGPVNETHSPTI